MISTSKEEYSNNVIHNHYLILSEESVLINNKINDIKKRLNVDENFDFEICSITECEYDDIINKIFTSPFVSQKRIVVIKNIEKKDLNELKEFAQLLPRVPQSCCLIMVYNSEKKQQRMQVLENFKKVCAIFPHAHSITLIPDEGTIYRWISNKLNKMGLGDRPEMVEYLMEEFENDLTGMKNELQKIENYLFQAKKMDLYELRDISQGLTHSNVYNIADNFFHHNPEAIKQFVRSEAYLKNSSLLIGALARALCDYAGKNKNEQWIRRICDELFYLDNRVKRGSDFIELGLEIFFIKNLST
ncbi:MAG: hypothetical protein N3A65_05390 [candidate division WOR-3 bacterium]|nr:hypothetical protein [candidate division WOR-3 bacterium]